MKKTMPITIESYTEIKDLDYYLVDKTKIIKIFDKIKSVFFIRPRRFGKSLTLSMLETFYSEKYVKDFDKYFKGMYIYDKVKELEYKQNKYPVIRLNFKNVQSFDSLEGYRAEIEDLVLSEYIKQGVISKEKIEKYNKGILKLGSLLREPVEKNKQTIVLIDEYDSPVNHAIGIGNYKLAEKILEDLKSFYLILKGNKSVAKTVITGINKLAKSGLFSGANQFFDITFDENFADQLGFTYQELNTILEYSGLKNVDMKKLKNYYNGYNFDTYGGSEKVYNPYSMLNYIVKNGRFGLYWVGSGTYKYLTDLINKLMITKNNEYIKLKKSIEDLFKGKQVTFDTIELGLNFELEDIDSIDVFRLMLYTGFITLSGSGLVIANKETFYELLSLYSFILKKEKLIDFNLLRLLSQFVLEIKMENFDNFEDHINQFIQAILKFRFTYYLKEQAYTLILASIFGFQTDYEVIGEQETGDGYADLVLTPTESGYPGYIFEFKRLTDKQMKQPGLEGGLKGLEAGFNGSQEGGRSSMGNVKLVKKCITQIKEKKYVKEMRKRNKKVKIYAVGVVMKGKKVVEMEIEEV